jgi:hypothetical protein
MAPSRTFSDSLARVVQPLPRLTKSSHAFSKAARSRSENVGWSAILVRSCRLAGRQLSEAGRV